MCDVHQDTQKREVFSKKCTKKELGEKEGSKKKDKYIEIFFNNFDSTYNLTS